MSSYIHKYHTISVLNSHEKGILKSKDEKHGQELIAMNYKELIPSGMLRRMSKVLKMGVGTALEVMKNESCNGIVVGSGIGCYQNSMTFTTHYLQKREGALSPTTFTQSTDNAIAGQIAIVLNNKGYNNTYIHKGLAFENALIDAMLLCDEEKGGFLVGGVDEWIREFEFIESLETKKNNYWIGEGASFFLIGSEKENAFAEISLCWNISTNKTELEKEILKLLKQNNLEQPDLILYGNSFLNQDPINQKILDTKTINYSEISGIYFTNSAFAMQMASEILQESKEHQGILIVNNFNDCDFGITYVSRI